MGPPPLWTHDSTAKSARHTHTHTQAIKLRALCLPVVGNEGELCCTALSSSNSLSSSDRLLPRAEVMAAADESDDFCLFGKLRRRQKRTTVNSSYQ